jgi:hypothetical protein
MPNYFLNRFLPIPTSPNNPLPNSTCAAGEGLVVVLGGVGVGLAVQHDPQDLLLREQPPRAVQDPRPQQRHQGDGEKDRQQQCGEEDQGYSFRGQLAMLFRK